jgi:hypothetical protein
VPGQAPDPIDPNEWKGEITNPKTEIPAFAGAASRRQAKFETNSNDRNPKRFGNLKI